jgi:F-type H+-transporting ATPase subunit delta
MSKISRRSLARWAADQLADGQPAATIAKHLAAVLSLAKMADQAEFLISDISWELEQRRVLTIGKVTSANPLTKQLESALLAHLKQITKSDNVVLEKNVDKSVLGGVRIETSARVWDQTVARQLTELKEVF